MRMRTLIVIDCYNYKDLQYYYIIIISWGRIEKTLECFQLLLISARVRCPPQACSTTLVKILQWLASESCWASGLYLSRIWTPLGLSLTIVGCSVDTSIYDTSLDPRPHFPLHFSMKAGEGGYYIWYKLWLHPIITRLHTRLHNVYLLQAELILLLN